MRSFTRDSEKASYSRSKHGSFSDEAAFKSPGESKKRWRRRCCWLLIGLAVVLVVLFLAGLITWLVVKPTYPALTIDDIAIHSVKVGQEHQGVLGLKVLMSMNMTAYLTAYNPNRLTISYEPTDVEVSYQDMALGNSTIPAFEEAPKTNSTMKTTLVVEHVNVLKGTGLLLLKDAAVNAIPMTLVGQVKAQAHFIGVASPIIKIGFNCILVVQPQGQTLGSKKCNVSNPHL